MAWALVGIAWLFALGAFVAYLRCPIDWGGEWTTS